MWWTLPFLVFFVLLALFLFLIFQRTTSTTSGGIGSSPATSSAPFEASVERPVEEEVEGKKNEEPTKAPPAAVTTPAAAEVASPSPAQMKAETQKKKNQTTTKTSVTRRKEQVATGQVLVVGGVDDLVATYAANEKDDRQRAASEAADPVESASLSGAALVARHLVAADGEATAERRGDGNVLAAYRHCHGSDGEREPVGVYYCNEKVDPEHWVKCVVNAWSLHHLLGASIPPIKTLAAPVEPSPWGMAMFEAMFPGITFVAPPSAGKCAVADLNSLQLWRTEEPATPTFHSVDAALAFKELFYERVQRPPHTRLPGQVTLLVQKQATILNEFDLAYLLAEVTHMPIAIVDLDKLPVLDQVRLMSNTGILVGMHGAGFVNALFLPRGAVTVEMFAGRYYSSVYGRYAAPGGVSAYSYHEPGVSSVTSSPQDQAAELAVSLESFRVVMQKAVQAWRDNNQLYYHQVGTPAA